MSGAAPADVPAGYSRMPEGVQCKCINLLRASDGSYWCCMTAAVTPATPASNRKAAAQSVRNALSSLNSALSVAQDAGLYVEIDYVTVEKIGRRHKTRVYHAIIETREPVE